MLSVHVGGIGGQDAPPLAKNAAMQQYVMHLLEELRKRVPGPFGLIVAVTTDPASRLARSDRRQVQVFGIAEFPEDVNLNRQVIRDALADAMWDEHIHCPLWRSIPLQG